MTSTVPSFDPHLLKLLAHQGQFSGKEPLPHAYFFTQPPPNTVATNLPRHLLGNGLSKLNTEKSLEQIERSVDVPSKKLAGQSSSAGTFDQWLQPPAGSLIQRPPCLPSDNTSSDLKSETILSSGERISCFIVGGEKRLCLPEILNTILQDFSLQEINSACERLHIYCSRCTPEQLEILKKSQVLPRNAPSCGLITQTDAERLCANLLQLRYQGQLRGTNPYERLYAIKVQHKCFGKCSGTFYPSLYVAPQAECVQCETCLALFSPKTFVSHGHKSEENRICHWGFDSDNWRAYLKIRSTEDLKAREEFQLVKEKFLTNPTRKHLTTPENLRSTTDKRSDRSTHSSRPTPLRVVRSNSPPLEQPINPSILHFNDFSPNGIRQIVESTVTSSQAREHLLTYISQLQRAARQTRVEQTSNESTLLRRENELLRERLAKYQDSTSEDSEGSLSSSHCNEPPKYFDRKRRLLAADGNISRKGQSSKKACLDQIVDSLNQKAAQAEQEEESEEEEKCLLMAEQSLTPERNEEEEEERVFSRT